MRHKKTIHSLKDILPPSQSHLTLYLHPSANGMVHKTHKTRMEDKKVQ